ncbi:MAG: hypothetical protein ACFFD6_01880 [Candidatus Thorarchaeota archaeon]
MMRELAKFRWKDSFSELIDQSGEVGPITGEFIAILLAAFFGEVELPQAREFGKVIGLQILTQS